MAEVGRCGLRSAVVAGLVLLCGSQCAMASGPNATTHTVIIEGMQFSPAALVVKAGDKVTWINRDPFPHTVTAEGSRFDSHAIEAGGPGPLPPRSAE